MNDIEDIKNELFCTNYELKIFSGNVNQGKLERWVRGFSSLTIEDSHLKRYNFANDFVKNKRVLDMATGSGYGSYMLAREGLAQEVTSIDIDKDAIKYAGIRNAHPVITFQEGDATTYCKPDYFDVIISFETIEHLPTINSYLKNINLSLKQDGRFLVSTPVTNVDLNTSPANVFHVQEWGFYNFQKEISKYFNIEKVFVQMYPFQSKNIFKRVVNKIFYQNNQPGYSTLEEYDKIKHRELIKDLGSKTFGYQILVCSKKV